MAFLIFHVIINLEMLARQDLVLEFTYIITEPLTAEGRNKPVI